MGRGRNVLLKINANNSSGFAFFAGTRLSTLFGLSLRDPSRVRSVRTLAGASRENGLPFELEIVELAINQGKLTADDPALFSEIWTDLLEPAADETFWHLQVFLRG